VNDLLFYGAALISLIVPMFYPLPEKLSWWRSYRWNPKITLCGRAKVIDGDTVIIKGQRLRLFGIDAPESAQTGRRLGLQIAIGKQATEKLKHLIDGERIGCHIKSQDRYGRKVAILYLDQLDINEWLVQQGQAVAYAKYSKKYVEVEQIAKRKKIGIWATRFKKPWDYREKK
jgi:endonuclease YncB( thermonuclease family)